MTSPTLRALCVSFLLLSLAACAGAASTPAAAPTTDVNPITGTRGGSSGR